MGFGLECTDLLDPADQTMPVQFFPKERLPVALDADSLSYTPPHPGASRQSVCVLYARVRSRVQPAGPVVLGRAKTYIRVVPCCVRCVCRSVRLQARCLRCLVGTCRELSCRIITHSKVPDPRPPDQGFAAAQISVVPTRS